MEKKLDLLIVDDEFSRENILNEIKNQFNIEIAREGKEAIEKVKSKNYDAILLDCIFTNQEMQGPDIAKAIKEVNKGSYIIGFSSVWKGITDTMQEFFGEYLNTFGTKEEVLKDFNKYYKKS